MEYLHEVYTCRRTCRMQYVQSAQGVDIMACEETLQSCKNNKIDKKKKCGQY